MGSSRIHPIIPLLAMSSIILAGLHFFRPIYRRTTIPAPTLWERTSGAPAFSRARGRRADGPVEKGPQAPFKQVPLYSPWARDVGDVDQCGVDLPLSEPARFTLNLNFEDEQYRPLLTTSELLFLAWVSHRYQINPHFLLGIMHAESAGDCSAVSVAGAQGCFQITDSAGADQLSNSYPKRTADWYWAKRSLTTLKHSPWPPQASGHDYYPRDLYVDPAVYFKDSPLYSPGMKIGRQLRRTLDPVATEIYSPHYGKEIPISSVASFGYGVVGAALYFQWSGHLLYAQALLHDALFDMAQIPGLKTRWMAASYIHGGPRGIVLMDRHGAAFNDHLWDEVETYVDRVTSTCLDLQQGEPIPDHKVTWLEFSDWLQELRWTYSSIDVDWEQVRRRAHSRFFARGDVPLAQIVAVFDAMMRWEPELQPETPILDFKMGHE